MIALVDFSVVKLDKYTPLNVSGIQEVFQSAALELSDKSNVTASVARKAVSRHGKRATEELTLVITFPVDKK